MALELPSGLEWLKYLVGMEWPHGNEDDMWAMAGDWHTAADGLREIFDDIDAAKAAALKAYPVGDGVDDMIKAFDSMRTGDQSLEKLAEFFDQVGETVNSTGTEIEYTKLMFYSSLALLAAEIAAAWIFPPTAPAVEAIAVGITRVAVRLIGERAVAWIIRNVAKFAATKVVSFLARHVLIDTVLGTMQELAIQQYQVDSGHRKEIDWNQVGATALSSAAGGAAAGPFGNWLGNRLGSEMKPWLRGAITGTGAGLVGAGGGMLGQFAWDVGTVGLDQALNNLGNAMSDPLMWSAGATNGAMSGLNHAGAHGAWQKMNPGLFNRPGLDTKIANIFGEDANLGGFGRDGANTPGSGDGSSSRTDDSTSNTGEGGSGRSGEQNMRPAGTTDMGEAGTDTGARAEGEDTGSGQRSEGGDQGGGVTNTSRSEPKADVQADGQGDGGGRADGGPRAEAGSRAEGGSDTTAAQSDSSRQEGRAEVADSASTTTGSDHGTRLDTASTDVRADTRDGGGLNDSSGTRDTTAAPVAAQHAAPAQQGAPAQQPAQTSNQAGSAPADARGQHAGPARPVGPEVRPGGEAPRVDQPRAPETRSATPESRATIDRAQAGDGSAPRPGAASRAGIAEPTSAGNEHGGVRAEQSAGEAPRARTTETEAQQVRAEAAQPEPNPRERSDADAVVPPVVPFAGPEASAAPARGNDAARATPSRDTPDAPMPRDNATDSTREGERGPVFDDFLSNGEGVVHGRTSTSFGDDPATSSVRDNLRNEGEHDVIVHGRADGNPLPGNGAPVHPEEIVQAILNNPNYVPGTPVRLMSCHAGNSAGWAQYVSDRLGVTVRAPDGVVGVEPTPNSPAVFKNERTTWKTFEPAPDQRVHPGDSRERVPALRSDATTTPESRPGLGDDSGPRAPDRSDDSQHAWMGEDADPPSSKLRPPDGADELPGISIDAQLLGTLDMSDARVQTDDGVPPAITHVDGMPIDEFTDRLAAERAAVYTTAEENYQRLREGIETANSNLDAAKTAKSEAGNEVKAAAAENADAKRELDQATKRLQAERDEAQQRDDDQVSDAQRQAEADLADAQRRADEAADRFQRAKEAVGQAQRNIGTATDARTAAQDALKAAEKDGTALSKGQRGQVTSITVDRLTGRVYEAANGPHDHVLSADELHPTVEENIRRTGADPIELERSRNGNHDRNQFPHPDNPMGHAEVRGTNQAMHDREAENHRREEHNRTAADEDKLPLLPTDHDGLASVVNAPYFPGWGENGEPVASPCCANCSRTVRGTESTTGAMRGHDGVRATGFTEPIRHVDLVGRGPDGSDAPPRLVSPDEPTDGLSPGDQRGPMWLGEDESPSMEPAMAKVAPVDGSSDVPNPEAHLLGELTGDIARDADGLIATVDGVHVDDLVRDLSRERRALYAELAQGVKDLKAPQLAAVKEELARLKEVADEKRRPLNEANQRIRQADPADRAALTAERDRLKAEFDEANKAAKAMQEEKGRIENRKDPIGPVLAVTIDRITGRVFEAANGTIDDLIARAQLHPELAVNVTRAGGELDKLANGEASRGFPQGDAALRHAEVKTTNAALRDRDANGLPDDQQHLPADRTDDAAREPLGPLASLVHAPIGVDRGNLMPCCANCTRMVRGTESATGFYQGHQNGVGVGEVSPQRHSDLAGRGPDGTDLRPRLISPDRLPTDPDPAQRRPRPAWLGDDDVDQPRRPGSEPEPQRQPKPEPRRPQRLPFAEPGDEDPGSRQGPRIENDDQRTPEREVRITLGPNGEVVSMHVRLEDGRWLVAHTAELPNLPANLRDATPDTRTALTRLVDRLNAGYTGLNLKYPSGSGLDGRGQTALRDGVVDGSHLFTDPPAHPAGPTPTPTPTPPSHDGPEFRPAPDPAGDPALNVARIGKEGMTVWQNRENLPVIGKYLGRKQGVAGEYHPVYLPDGSEYRPWITDGDPRAVRDQVISDLEVERITQEAAAEVLAELFRTGDPELRRELINDLWTNDLIDYDEARALEEEPPYDPTPDPDPTPPEHETIAEMAARLGFDLDDDSPQALRRAIDAQTHRVLREAAAIEGLADAAHRAAEEQSRPYRRPDHPPEEAAPTGVDRDNAVPGPRHDPRALDSEDTRRTEDPDDDFDGEADEPRTRGSHWGDTSAPRPVPFSDAVSFFDDNPMGRFLRDLIVAFEGDTALRDYDRVGNGADRLPEWGNFASDAELGRDEATRAFFEHALRRDQLRDELSSWAAMFGLDLSDLSGGNLEPTLAQLREAALRHAQQLTDFINAAEPILRGDQSDPVGQSYNDQVARVPGPDGGPDRLLVTDGPLDRVQALARALDENPDLAQRLRDKSVVVDFRDARTDGLGNVHLDPVATPEVEHVRHTIDGTELAVTMVRGEDGNWYPVQAEPDPVAPPRDREQMVREIVDLARELNLTPVQLHPDNLARTLADLSLDNAVRAGQIEMLADYARTMTDIETFHLVGDARGQLADRLGLTERELTPQRLGEALANRKQRNALRDQQFEDLLDGPRDGAKTDGYSRQLRIIDAAAVDAAQAQLLRALGVDDPAPLRPRQQKQNAAGKFEYGPADKGIDPRKLRKLISRMQRRGHGDVVQAALTQYAEALLAIDRFSEVPKGDRSADPRTTGEPHIYDIDAVHGLRDVVGGALPGADVLDFGRAIADNVGRSFGADTTPDPNRPRPLPNRDWARLVGVDVSTADNEQFHKVYEAYRDGKIEKHEGLSPTEMAAEVARMREEVRTRAEQIARLRSLTGEFYTPAADLPAGPPAQPGGPAAPSGPSGPNRPGGPLDPGSGPNRSAEPGELEAGSNGARPDEPKSEPDAEIPERGTELDARADTRLAETMRALDDVATDLDRPLPTLDDLVGPGEPVDPLAAIDDAVRRQNTLADNADERREAAADAALDDALTHLDSVDEDLAALESYRRAQAEFDAARLDIDGRFARLTDENTRPDGVPVAGVTRPDGVPVAGVTRPDGISVGEQTRPDGVPQAGQTRPDGVAEANSMPFTGEDAAALASYLRAQAEFDALRDELAAVNEPDDPNQTRPDGVDPDDAALQSYLRAQEAFDAAHADITARFAELVNRDPSATQPDGLPTDLSVTQPDGVPTESAVTRPDDVVAEPNMSDGAGERLRSDDDGDSTRRDDESGDDGPVPTQPAGPPSKPPSNNPVALTPDPEEPAKRTVADFPPLPGEPAELAVPDAARPDLTGNPDAADESAQPERTPALDDVTKFLQELADLPPSVFADATPLSEADREHVRRLAEALGLGDALTGLADPLGALAEIADAARARGFLDAALDPDAELGAPMRYPGDYEALDLDELSDGLDPWRVEGDPDVRARVADELRAAGLDDGARPDLTAAPEPDPAEQPVRPAGLIPPGDGPAQHPGTPRLEPAQQAAERLAARFGIDPDNPAAMDAQRYRNVLRAGTVEAFAETVRRYHEATDPAQRAQLEASARRWANRLGLAPDPGLTRAADDVTRLRAGVARDAADLRHLADLHAADLDDRHFSVEVDGERIVVRVVEDGPGSWRVEPVERPPAQTVVTETAPAPRPEKPKTWLHRLWDRVTRGYFGEYPKYPSGSGIDSAGQSLLGHEAGLPLTKMKDPTPNGPHGDEYEQLQTKFNPVRILKEGVLMWQNRELVPILKHLSSRMADQAGEFLPLRNLDGSEYKPWISDADPELRRQIEQDLRDAGLEHLLEPESRPELAAGPEAAEPVQIPRSGEAPLESAEPLPPWAQEVVDAIRQRLVDAAALDLLAAELGIQLTDYSPDGLRRAVAEGEYRLLRRDGVIEGLAAAARGFNEEHAHTPYRSNRFNSNDPLGSFLKELVAANGGDTSILDWRGVNNGGEWVSHWNDLEDSEQPGRDQGLRKYFENALRRSGLRDERSMWAHLAGADLEALARDLDAQVANLRAQLDNNTGVLDEFARRAAEFADADSGDRLILDTENGRIAVVDTGGGHEEALARALAGADADFLDRVNRGEVTIDVRAVAVDETGRVHIVELDAPEVRHVRSEVDGRQVDITMLRDGLGPWRMVELPPTAPEPATSLAPLSDDTTVDGAQPRSAAEIRADLAGVAQRLGIDDPTAMPADELRTLLSDLERANQVRARQVEGLVDYALSADAIDTFNDLHKARSAVAHRIGVSAQDLTPESVAQTIGDPATPSALRRQQIGDLAAYAKVLSGVDPSAVTAARDALAPHLGLDRGALPAGADALHEAIANRLGRGDLSDLTGPLADYVRALGAIDPFTDGLVYDPATDPRAIGDDPPVHARDALDFLREIGATDLSGTSPLPGRPEGELPGPSRDYARLLGVDLTDADPTRWAEVYEAFRDGRIDKHERLSLDQLAEVHEQIRDEIRRRTTDLAALRALLSEPQAPTPDLASPEHGALPATPPTRPDNPSSDGGLPPGSDGRDLPPAASSNGQVLAPGSTRPDGVMPAADPDSWTETTRPEGIEHSAGSDAVTRPPADTSVDGVVGPTDATGTSNSDGVVSGDTRPDGIAPPTRPDSVVLPADGSETAPVGETAPVTGDANPVVQESESEGPRRTDTDPVVAEDLPPSVDRPFSVGTTRPDGAPGVVQTPGTSGPESRPSAGDGVPSDGGEGRDSRDSEGRDGRDGGDGPDDGDGGDGVRSGDGDGPGEPGGGDRSGRGDYPDPTQVTDEHRFTQLPGSALRSHIPHPPHEYEVDLEVPLFDRPRFPVLSPQPTDPPGQHQPPQQPPYQQQPPSYPQQPTYPTPAYPPQPSYPPMPSHPPMPTHPPQPSHPPMPTYPPQPSYPTQPPAPSYPTPNYPPPSYPPTPPSYPTPSNPSYPTPTYPTPSEPGYPNPSYPSQPGTPTGPNPSYPTQPGTPTGPNPGPTDPSNAGGPGGPNSPGGVLPPWHNPTPAVPTPPWLNPGAPTAPYPGAPGNGSGQHAGDIPPPMYPPGTPMPGGGGGQAGGGQGNRRYRPEHSDSDPGHGVVVRPFTGYGVPAQFDPHSGILHAAPPHATSATGVYSDLGDTPVVFYRGRDGLAMRAGHQAFHLDGPVDIVWETSPQRLTRFAVVMAGQVQCELIYRSLPPELDLGLLIRDVVADPSRRATIFH